MTAWCIWCETGDAKAPEGYFWIHHLCAHELMDCNDNIKSVKEILQGIHARNKTEEDRLKVVYNFVKDMEDFKRRWDGTMKMIESLKVKDISKHNMQKVIV